jgi:hypothetical protein
MAMARLPPEAALDLSPFIPDLIRDPGAFADGVKEARFQLSLE